MSGEPNTDAVKKGGEEKEKETHCHAAESNLFLSLLLPSLAVRGSRFQVFRCYLG